MNSDSHGARRSAFTFIEPCMLSWNNRTVKRSLWIISMRTYIAESLFALWGIPTGTVRVGASILGSGTGSNFGLKSGRHQHTEYMCGFKF